MIANDIPQQRNIIRIKPVANLDQLVRGDHVHVVLKTISHKSFGEPSPMVYEGRTDQGELSFLAYNDAPQGGLVSFRSNPTDITFGEGRVGIPVVMTTTELYSPGSREYFERKNLMEGNLTG